MTLREKMFLIADTYGYDAQSRQCIEEMAELTQAINKFWRKQLRCGKKDLRDIDLGTKEELNLIEEIADVKIMIEQLEYLLVADATPITEKKVERQLKRIQENCLERKNGVYQGTTPKTDDE